MTIDPKTLLKGDIITVRMVVGKWDGFGQVRAGPICDPNRHFLKADTEILSVERPKPKVGDFVQFIMGSVHVWEVIAGPRAMTGGRTTWSFFNPDWGYLSFEQSVIDEATIVDRPDWAGEAGGE